MPDPNMIHVVAAEGATVRDPRTRTIIPAEGMLVPAGDPYWMALLRFGDVRAEAPAPHVEQ